MERFDERICVIRCKACGKPVYSEPFCGYCQEMREELRCWPE